MSKLQRGIIRHKNATVEAIKTVVEGVGKKIELGEVVESHMNKIGTEEFDSEALIKAIFFPTLTFVHVNDAHATYGLKSGSSLLSRIRGYVDRVRAENPYTIFAHGGDFFEKGSVAELLSLGKATQRMYEAMGFDVAVFGNHDFSWSEEQAMEYSHTHGTKMLASNVEYVGQKSSKWGALKFVILERGGLKILLWGMVSKQYNEWNEITEAPYYPGTFELDHNYEKIAREIIAEHGHKVDFMVMLSHIGLKADRKVASKVMKGGMVLSGHSHSKLKKPVVDEDGTIIGQTDAYATGIVRIDVDFDRTNPAKPRRKRYRYEYVKNDDSLPVNKKVEETEKKVMDEFAPDAHLPLASVSKELNKKEIAGVVADGAVHELGVDAAFVDLKTVWEEKWEPEKPLTPQSLVDTLEVERQPAGKPGFSSFYIVEVSEEDLLQMFANANPDRWVSSSSKLKPKKKYRVALPRRAALHIDDYDGYFGKLIEPASEPVLAGEMWEVAANYGRYRNAQNLYIDADVELAA
jgi:predicted MPP superfamily phosphohydrolase